MNYQKKQRRGAAKNERYTVMGKIIVLDELTVNKIAAGEVIERPASVIKEMVENSIDSGATQITVEIRRGGITYIRLTDNGSGISCDDAVLAFEKHATSKIKCGDDLDAIETLGFRGEALSSISAVSKVEVTTKVKNEKHGVKVTIHGGSLVENTSCGCPDGTTFVVRDLFFNTPARFKFLKKDATEAGHVIDLIERMALAHPQIAFKLINSGSEVIRTRGDGVLKNVIYSIYGKSIADSVKEINFADKGIEITGFAGDINSASSSRGRQSLFVNGRYVRSKVIYASVDEAYKTLMMKGKYPFIILNIKISPQHVDVNVHPTKMEVRFSDDGSVYRWVYNSVGAVLYERQNINDGLKNTGFAAELYKTPYDIKTKSEVKEEKTEYIRSEQQLPLKAETINVNEKKRQENFSAVQSGGTGVSDENNLPDVTVCKPEKSSVYAQGQMPGQLENRMLADAVYIGQTFDTYIIVQYNDKILFIDQHAAHERVMYEKIKQQYKNTKRSVQPLLVPEVIELTAGEFTLYKDNYEYIKSLGFISEEFGDNSILIREIPSFINIYNVKQVIMDIIRDIFENNINVSGNAADINDDVLKIMACKGAVKANNKLDEKEVKALLDDMAKLENPFTCPHGRPIVIRMTKTELEKKFKRIV